MSDIFPTGYMAAEFCDIKGGEIIAVFGCGPVAQFAIRSAFLLGAERVIAIDTVPERLALAKEAGVITIDFMHEKVYERIQELTQGRGADACASMRSALSRTPRPVSIRSSIAPRPRSISGQTVRTCCAKRSIVHEISASSRSSAYTAGLWIRSRWPAPPIAA